MSSFQTIMCFREAPLRFNGHAWKRDTALDTSDEAADLLTAAPSDAPGSPRAVRLSLNFDDGGREVVHYVLEDCALDQLKFEIRVYNLKYRQPSGISVHQARAYLRRFGGVHIYDAGFHLPYYGPDADWLHIEMDHSHRLSVSKLLPKELTQGSSAVSPLNYLPTNSRLFGVVDVDTSHEFRVASGDQPCSCPRSTFDSTYTRPSRRHPRISEPRSAGAVRRRFLRYP